MNSLRVDLDSGSRHYLVLAPAGGGFEISLHHSSTQRRSLLHEALRRHLRLRTDGNDLAFPPDLDEFPLPAGARRLTVLLGAHQSLTLAVINLPGEPRLEGERYILSPFESRFLADNGSPHPVPRSDCPAPAMRTDLHSHFAGCVSPGDLAVIGARHGVRYPTSLLAEMGIHVEPGDDVALGDLPDDFLRQLQSRLSIPLDHQATFIEMEKIYRLRGPITKSPAAFIPLCGQIAADYGAMGATYVELSLSNIVEADRLRDVHRELPAIEKQTGVTIRFLAAFHRLDDLEWDLDYIDRIAALAGSRYVVGADFMGHETNSTRAFATQLKELARWADRARPGFVIRVHAGENPAHPENVRIAMESVAGCNVQLRIGHGLYGVDAATLDQLRDSGAIVEFNLNSNFALNNIQDAAGAPIKRYIASGVPVVLGTDGYGIYQTTLALEARAAMLCGLDADDFQRISATESSYIARQKLAAATLPEASAFDVPPEAPLRHYTPQVLARNRESARQRDELLTNHLAAMGVPLLDSAAVSSLLLGRQCISFAGAWKASWKTISPENQQRVRNEIGKLLRALDPRETVLVTGGTCFGVEGLVQELAIPLGFTILGALVLATPSDSLIAGSITHACLVGKNLYDKAAGLYQLMKEFNGLCLFIGGGTIVNDEIQTAVNLRLRFLLMDGPEGASTLQARQTPGHAFTTAEDVLSALKTGSAWASGEGAYWHLGANPTVDIVLTRDDPRSEKKQILLIQRDVDSPTEGGKWALPGGFQLTDAPRGQPWHGGMETPREACVRELLEESGVDVRDLGARLIQVGVYEGGGRDPRDTPTAWSRSEVFALHLPSDRAAAPLRGADDACDARWFDLNALPPNLAFDHAKILMDGLKKLW